MAYWIFIAIFGVVLAFFGLKSFYKKFRRNEVSIKYLLTIIIGIFSFLSYALLNSIQPEITNELVTTIILIPAFISILIVINENKKSNIE